MTENRPRDEKPTPSAKPSAPTEKTIFSGMGKVEQMFEEGVPVQYVPHILYSTVLLIFYIMNSYVIDRKKVLIQTLKADVEDLRADYTTLKADYMYSSKQSEVARRVEPMGLKEVGKPPYKIEIDKKELED